MPYHSVWCQCAWLCLAQVNATKQNTCLCGATTRPDAHLDIVIIGSALGVAYEAGQAGMDDLLAQSLLLKQLGDEPDVAQQAQLELACCSFWVHPPQYLPGPACE